jgi:hypothetical protein
MWIDTYLDNNFTYKNFQDIPVVNKSLQSKQNQLTTQQEKEVLQWINNFERDMTNYYRPPISISSIPSKPLVALDLNALTSKSKNLATKYSQQDEDTLNALIDKESQGTKLNEVEQARKDLLIFKKQKYIDAQNQPQIPAQTVSQQVATNQVLQGVQQQLANEGINLTSEQVQQLSQTPEIANALASATADFTTQAPQATQVEEQEQQDALAQGMEDNKLYYKGTHCYTDK